MSRQSANQTGDWVAMLKARPVRNTAARAVENRRNGITVYVKRQRPAWFIPPVSWIVPYRGQRRVTLDTLGRRLWDWCDGRTTVEDVIDRFGETYDLTFHEARAAVTNYLQMLIKRGVLAIIMQEDS